MENFNIRAAKAGDLNRLLDFEQGIILAERPFDPTLKPNPINYYNLAEMIDRQDVEIAVAEINGEIVASGYARIEESKPYLKHPKHAYLGFMFVDPKYRGKGLNAKIMDYLKKWSKNKGITEMRLDVYAKNASAIKAYQKFGFESHLVEMRMPID